MQQIKWQPFPGSCALLVDYDDLITATIPVPDKYLSEDHLDVGAVYETRITREYLLTKPYSYLDVKLPQTWKVAGYYPHKYCVRYLANRDEYTVSLEDFVYRQTE